MRLFVALYPPPDVAEAMLGLLADTARAAGALPAHRITPAAQVHMTLQFIGERREQDVDEVIESVERSAAGIGACALTPTRLITLPERGPARLIAVQTDSPSPLLELQRRLATRLARKTRRQAGDRFMPHFTLARFSEEASGFRLDMPLGSDASRSSVEVRAIVLMRSVLHATGAEHREVVRVAL